MSHKHICMRCLESFDCRTPDACQAREMVLPNIVTQDEDGHVKIDLHCPEKPDWEWIRGYGERMKVAGKLQALSDIEAARLSVERRNKQLERLANSPVDTSDIPERTAEQLRTAKRLTARMKGEHKTNG